MAQLPREVGQGWLGSGGPKEYQIDLVLSQLAREYIVAHPRETLALWPAKLRYLLATDHTAFEWARSRDFRSTALFEKTYEYSRVYYLALDVGAVEGCPARIFQGSNERDGVCPC
jgi:hypothetical protein